MKKMFIPVLMVLGFSMFLGIVAISIGLGSAVTSVNKPFGALVCSSGTLEVGQNDYSWRPGQGTISADAVCVNNQTGQASDVTTRLQITAGVIYGLVIFVILVILLQMAARKLGTSFSGMFTPTARR